MEENPVAIFTGMPSNWMPVLPYSFANGCITPQIASGGSYNGFTTLSCVRAGSATISALGLVTLFPQMGANGLIYNTGVQGLFLTAVNSEASGVYVESTFSKKMNNILY